MLLKWQPNRAQPCALFRLSKADFIEKSQGSWVMLEFERPALGVPVSNINMAEQQFFPCWHSHIPTSNYVNLVAFDETGQVMIIEDLTANSAWGSWHFLGSLLNNKENPLTVSQHKLLSVTGYSSSNWSYLGSFMLDTKYPEATGHFFAARDVKLIKPNHSADPQTCLVKWISPRQLKYALLDGRIGIMSYAFTAAMALLMLPQLPLPPLSQ